MTDPKEPYSIDPGDVATPSKAPAPSPSPEAPPTPAKPRHFDVPLPPPTQPKGKIEAPELLAGFEEDADFDKDPEVDRVILGKPAKVAAPEPEQKPPPEDFVQPGIGGAKVWAIVGVILLVSAMIATGTSAQTPRFARVILILYNTLLHTGTGVVSLFGAATLLRKRFGNFELAAARMFAAVCAFALMFSLRLTLFDVPWLDNILVLLISSAVYVLLVCSTFGLWKKIPLGYVVGFHFFLWLIVQIGMMLSAFVAAQAPVAKPSPAPHTSPVAPPTKPPVTASPPAASAPPTR